MMRYASPIWAFPNRCCMTEHASIERTVCALISLYFITAIDPPAQPYVLQVVWSFAQFVHIGRNIAWYRERVLRGCYGILRPVDVWAATTLSSEPILPSAASFPASTSVLTDAFSAYKLSVFASKLCILGVSASLLQRA